MRTLFLLASASCAFVAAGIAFGWSIFDLDDPSLHGDVAGWGWTAVALASSGLVWGDVVAIAADLFAPVRRRYHR